MSLNCTDSAKKPNEEISYLIWRLLKYWQRGKQRLLDEFGLTSSQMELLGAIYHLSEQEKDLTQIVLSQKTEIDPMTTSTILRNLQKKGLINRRESTTDTRARVVEVTDVGAALFIKAKAKVIEEQDKLLKNIDKKALMVQLELLINEVDRFNKMNN